MGGKEGSERREMMKEREMLLLDRLREEEENVEDKGLEEMEENVFLKSFIPRTLAEVKDPFSEEEESKLMHAAVTGLMLDDDDDDDDDDDNDDNGDDDDDN